jgi:primosomal protein N' (replication factor Y) (superfamily II helicase)
MYIQVRLLKSVQDPLWYRVPADWNTKNLLGAAVNVPLRNQIVPALVEKISDQKPGSYKIKYAQSKEPFPHDVSYNEFIKKLAYYYQEPPLHFIKRIRQFIVQKEVKSHADKNVSSLNHKKESVILTDEQQQIVDFLLPKITQSIYCPTLVHGVTGSGKTELYKKFIEYAMKEKRSVILLLPEVTLAVQFFNKLKQQLSIEIAIFGFHSATGPKEKRLLWQKIVSAEPVLIIGVHLPILLPIENLGLIIIDEEHEMGFQEKKHPKINSKEAALLRAQLCEIPIILGSATPSLSSLYNVQQRGWHFFQLKKRFAGEFPKIAVVPLNDKKKRKYFWITDKLKNAISDRLTKKEQTILFLNRRGYSFFVQCKQCSFVFSCSHCSVSLTLHCDNRLVCHYCNFAMILPIKCSDCKQTEFLKKGIGTQQLVMLLQKIYPHARIERADMDTTVNKKHWQQVMHNFESGTIDILVGTQTITKGYHFPGVTLVGILWADLNLHFPSYNAAETTLQQLIQVAGRAGRQHINSLVVVQTMMDHPVFDYLNEIDYIKFFKKEFASRKEVKYPPYMRLAEIELKHQDESIIADEAQQLANELSARINKDAVRLLGPTLPPVHKVKKIYMRKIYLKSKNIHLLIDLFQQINKKRYKSGIFFTPNP